MADRIGREGTRARDFTRLAWLLATAAAFLAPAISTGYWSEDLYQSIIPRGDSVIHGTSPLGEVAAHVKVTLTIGRFFPLTPILMTTVHWIFREAWSYKAYIVATGVLDIFLFYLVASRLTGRRDYACFASCLTVGLIQYRVAVDQSLGFSGQVQLVIASMLLCLLTLQNYLETRRWAWLIASALSYLCANLLYEVAYLLVLMPLVLILRAPDGWARRFWTAMPFCGGVGFCAFESFLVRWLFPGQAYWHQTSFDSSAVAMALVHQASAGFPLTYLAFDPLKIFPGPGGLIGWLFDARAALVAVPAGLLSFACLRRGDRSEVAEGGRDSLKIGGGWLAALGLILAICPTVMVAISPYHRSRIAPGVGWSPVLIQYYGVGLLLSAGIWGVVRAMIGGGPRARWKCLAASIAVGGLVGTTYRANLDVVRCFNAPIGSTHYREVVSQSGGSRDGERRLLESALRSGLMDAVPAQSIVQSANSYPFWFDAGFGRFFYAANAGKPFLTLPPWLGAGLDGYRVRDVVLGPDSGFVVLSKGLRAPATPDDQPPTGGLRLFVRHPGLSSSTSFRVAAGAMPDIEGLRPIQSGRDWAVYDLGGLATPVAPEQIRVVFGGKPGGDARPVAGESGQSLRR